MKRRSTRRKDQAAFFQDALKPLTQIDPLCSHANECGGCDIQQYAYEDQLAAKLSTFKEMIEQQHMSRPFADIEVQAMASPRVSRYRQKMDFVCASGKSGLRGGGFDKIVELDECHLIEEESFKLYKRALELVKEEGLPDYNFFTHKGYLRYITIRRTRLGQQLISFLTSSMENSESLERIATTLINENLTNTVQWQLAAARGDSSFGTPYRYWGQEFIEEKILDYRFKLSSNTFFQANLEVAEKAYVEIRDHVKASKAQNVLDLYSGTCTIGICLSDCAEKLTAVENFTPNRDMAFKNFETNKITNINYIDKDVAEFIDTYEETPDYVVCNPPRAGVDERPLRKLMKLKPKSISYLSCNPKTLLEDLAIMTLHYKIDSAKILDMFPQTKHFETLVQLSLK
ncbi:MAG: 23S rRNA (uracil(1939)-C(5))-methyltransferase RlmD [Lentisphaeraceae bacterium]|nr:23S rRNA (uracil(1939)-C(5))-methyltransferase RlmD [Lentisphaeraceae bacterium]